VGLVRKGQKESFLVEVTDHQKKKKIMTSKKWVRNILSTLKACTRFRAHPGKRLRNLLSLLLKGRGLLGSLMSVVRVKNIFGQCQVPVSA
jgi:hypothetical protein